MNAQWKKPTFFGALYFLQGSAFAYVVNFQKPYLAGEGVSKESLGLFTSLLLLPFILKVFLGVLSDRVPIGKYGSRRPYMVMGLLLFASAYLLLTQVHNPANNFMMFAIVTWFASLGLALFDTCCDGLAVDVTKPTEQGTVQAAMVAGRALGLISMSGSFGFLAQKYGFQVIFGLLAALAVLTAALVVLVDFKAAPVKRVEVVKWTSLATPAFVFFAFYGVIYCVISFGVDGIVTLYLQEMHKAGPAEIGKYGVFRGLGAIGGAAIALGMIRHHKDLNAVAWRCMIGLSIGTLIVSTGQIDYGIFWGFAYGAQETIFFSLALAFSRGPWSATFYALCMIFGNIGTAIGEGLAAPLSAAFGYQNLFFGFAGAAVIMSVLTRRWLKVPGT